MNITQKRHVFTASCAAFMVLSCFASGWTALGWIWLGTLIAFLACVAYENHFERRK